jgi:hypothetical protein
MGWLTFHMTEPVKDWYKTIYDSTKVEVLDVAIVKRTQLYAALKIIETGEVICDVMLLTFAPRSYDNFGYKGIGENNGPVICECPLRIMKLLTPIAEDDDTKGFAKEWRARVYEHHAKAKSITGDCIVKTSVPVRFRNGSEFEYFQKSGRRIYGVTKIGEEYKFGCRVNFSLKNYKFEVVKKC